MGIHLKSVDAQQLMLFGMARDGFIFIYLRDIVSEEIQVPFSRQFRIKLPQAARGSIPRIGKKRLAFLFLPLVKHFENIFTHNGLAPHFKEFKMRFAKTERDGMNSFE